MLWQREGARFSRLSSSWAPFLVAAASLLKPNGRMAFVVPAEIGHATYSIPLIEWLCGQFEHVRVVAFRDKLFPELSEDAWFLYCAGHGGRCDCVHLNQFEAFVPGEPLPRFAKRVELSGWRQSGCRLRRFLLPGRCIALYDELSAQGGVVRLSDVARAGIGYVTGANDFFHLRPSQSRAMGIPADYLRVAIRKSQQLPSENVSAATVEEWLSRDEPVMLLDLTGRAPLPRSVLGYLSSDGAREAQKTYKCRNRDPWYVVPDIRAPDAFLSCMSGVRPSLVRNEAGCVCTNSIHAVSLHDGVSVRELQKAWQTPLCELSCELEGHPLGGGMLKLEPREAGNVRLPLGPLKLSRSQEDVLKEGIVEARRWRHYG